MQWSKPLEFESTPSRLFSLRLMFDRSKLESLRDVSVTRIGDALSYGFPQTVRGITYFTNRQAIFHILKFISYFSVKLKVVKSIASFGLKIKLFIITHLQGQTYVWHRCKWNFAGPQIYLQPAEIKSSHFGVSLKFLVCN